MQFGGKVFIIGVGKDEQVVCFLSKCIGEIFKFTTSVPFHAPERE